MRHTGGAFCTRMLWNEPYERMDAEGQNSTSPALRAESVTAPNGASVIGMTLGPGRCDNDSAKMGDVCATLRS